MIAICAPDSLLTDLEELNDNIVDLDIVEQMEQDGNLLDVVFMLLKLGQYIDIMKKVEHDLIVNIRVKLAHVDSEALAALILNKLYAGIKRADDMQPVLESMAVFPVYLAIREMTRYSSTQRKGASGFLSSSTAEEVTHGIDDSGFLLPLLQLFGNMTAGKDVREAIVKETPIAKVDTIELDLSSLASVKKFSTELKSSGRPLNLLIYGNYGAYGQSKLANILRANELTRRLKGASNANVEQNGGLATFAKDCKDD
ncbi:putative short-chain dehydrogenase TIC 32, chloroplastic-like isoform 1 [Capsicum annuum]|nr:putative short-chain dehydrogenase TIC 32, chloroplastic-like isoform 1 [Capsicum annuum]